MKKCLAAVLFIVLIGVASASCLGYDQQSMWYWVDGQPGSPAHWSSPTINGDLARLFTSVVGDPSGNCNRKEWTAYLEVQATIAQWITWSLGANRWDWQVRKPGIYAGDCIQFKVKSNDDVTVDFDDFANLTAIEIPGQVEGTIPIPIYFGFGDTPQAVENLENPIKKVEGLPGWYTPTALNSEQLTIGFDDMVVSVVGGGYSNQGWSSKIMNKIEVGDIIRACDYYQKGKITLKVSDLKYFIDGASGDFNGKDPSQNGNRYPRT